MQTPGLEPSLATHSASFEHGPHLFAEQIGFVISAVQSALELHSTHAPVDAHTDFVLSLVRHAMDGAFEQPTHALPTQNVRFGSAVHCESVEHSTHLPLLPLQTGVCPLQAPAPAAW